MKRVIYFLFAVMVLSACIDEVAIPVEANFDTEIVDSDQTVPVRVRINNNTEGADTYKWEFEGGDRTTSNDRNPGIITYEQPGEYTIKLEASNRDGSFDVIEKKVIAKPAVNIGFDVAIDDNFSPVKAIITNTTTGATSYQWFFEGGLPASSTEQNPPEVIFTTPGEHKIILMVDNGDEQQVIEKSIEVAPLLAASFDTQVTFEDDDFQAPVTIALQNKSVSATGYQWELTGSNVPTSTDENLSITYTTPGTYTIKLIASNSKGNNVATKQITVTENTNLRTFENIKLGINTAHKDDTIGAFFSTSTREVYTASEITDEIGAKIDLVFFGLNEEFIFNKFVSPDEAMSSAFTTIPNAVKTTIINKLEGCNCGVTISEAEFDAMNNDNTLQSLVITATTEGSKEFDNTVVPRIVVFETADKRKGAIKIKEFTKNGLNSFITVDIKVQKEAR
ncbi:PKD domain-containing protein [Tenacibaculum agarivorans]|uniref:PKD domain-containing protein n=1 Tax=Tenacibaculum agarivorans TaxID=1908389 RepID=UPI00094B8F06|nr:PKD domain-containing protein [Tenacibaculum agarivorans]